MTALGFEARNGSPSGRLSAESAGEFLAHHLIHCYSSMSAPPPRSSGGLPGNRLKVILEYIEVNLAQPLSLHELARLSGVSPRHFERAFRQATGEALHAHVLRIRVLAARGSFAEWARPHHRRDFCADGLQQRQPSSLSFRRHMGCTPSEFRRHVHNRPHCRSSPVELVRPTRRKPQRHIRLLLLRQRASSDSSPHSAQPHHRCAPAEEEPTPMIGVGSKIPARPGSISICLRCSAISVERCPIETMVVFGRTSRNMR
jgi:AraC-like DNA-binding protein